METLSRAIAIIRGHVEPLDSEVVGLDRAIGRVLASAVVARYDAPAFDNSAMDGYAVRSSELQRAAAESPVALAVASEIAAGATGRALLASNAVARIFTGAPIPEGADAVVAQEDVERDGERAIFRAPAPRGKHIRRRGEDAAAGSAVLSAGTTIRARERAILASQSCAVARVTRRPRVAIISTGDELIDVGEQPHVGQVIDSNTWLLAGLIDEAGGEARVLPRCPDDLEATIDALARASNADVVITVGGASVGEHDHVRTALARSQVALLFERVRLKPGKPTAFGHRAIDGRKVLYFALPGNPVSAAVTFEIFVRPAIRGLLGDPRPYRPALTAELSRPYQPAKGRTELARGAIDLSSDTARVQLHDKQSSGALSALAGTDALVVFPAGSGAVAPGEPVRAILLGDSTGSASSPVRDGE